MLLAKNKWSTLSQRIWDVRFFFKNIFVVLWFLVLRYFYTGVIISRMKQIYWDYLWNCEIYEIRYIMYKTEIWENSNLEYRYSYYSINKSQKKLKKLGEDCKNLSNFAHKIRNLSDT